MRIGMISGEYPPDQGGVGDFTHHLTQSLVALGHQVHVITSASSRPLQEHPLSVHAARSRDVSVHRLVRRWNFGCWRRILEISRDAELDVLDIQYQAAAYTLHPAINLVPPRQWRPAAAVTFHDLKVPYLFPKAGPLRRWMVNLLARRVEGVIVTNSEDEAELAHLSPPLSNLTRIPIGSNIPLRLPSDFDRTAERASWGIGPHDLLLGYFGFLNESKGGETLIEALHLLVEQGLPAHLLKIGGRTGTSDPTNQSYAERIDALIARRGLEQRVHWTGYLRPDQVSASLRAVDVCVLPYRDGVSFRRGSLLACLTHGRAVVTTRSTLPLPEVTEDESMVLVEPGNPAALARAIEQVAHDPELRARLETGAESLAGRFTWDRIAQQTLGFLEALVTD